MRCHFFAGTSCRYTVKSRRRYTPMTAARAASAGARFTAPADHAHAPRPTRIAPPVPTYQSVTCGCRRGRIHPIHSFGAMERVARPTAAKATAPAAQTGLRTTTGCVPMPEDCRGPPSEPKSVQEPARRVALQRYLVEILVVRPEGNPKGEGHGRKSDVVRVSSAENLGGNHPKLRRSVEDATRGLADDGRQQDVSVGGDASYALRSHAGSLSR